MRGRLSSATRSDRCAHPRAVRRAGTRRHGQRGAIAVLAVIWLSVAIAALGVLDVGNVYFARRSLQRTADLAALAAVQMISSSGGCAAATTAAQQNAAANGFSAGGTTTIATTCGRWDTSTNTYFGTTGNPLNAVQVQTSQVIPYFFLGPSRAVTTTATALASNIDAFSLSTGIATINTQQSALLNAILGGLLNTSVALTVGNFQSLAGATIKLSDLMVALGASSMQGLLSTTVSYQQLMLAMVQALQAGGDTVDAAILQTLAVTVPGGQNITIGDNGPSAPGLLALGLSNPNAAATATIDALDAVMVAAQIAQSNPNGTGPVINVNAGLAGVAGLSLQITQPPVLAVGEGGTTTVGGVSTARTVARTASINAVVTLLPIALQPINLGVATISALSTPIVLNLKVAAGKATLSSVDCESSKAATNATIQVQPSIAALCLGTNSSCGGPIVLANISVILVGNVASVQLDALGPYSLTPGSTPIVFNGSSGSFDSTASANSNPVGTDASALATPLLAALPSALHIEVFGNYDLSGLLTPLLSLVTTAVTPLLQTVFNLLDAVLIPTLSLLGVQVGTATVHNMSLTCGVPQLVN
ncbi:TadG family pilus assembly protein [Paraburkholderia bryophila]|uniref:Putative membrane protein n=1 Tax=Paraburkholderia bryophila TaxID=420952 RepID=A0A329BQS7_9BURK|nr:TadG family pilus assembly protein [Paraburkholderia bryophila]RAS24250.1 putative membrane protein [Paraburkholderia bryophila]